MADDQPTVGLAGEYRRQTRHVMDKGEVVYHRSFEELKKELIKNDG